MRGPHAGGMVRRLFAVMVVLALVASVAVLGVWAYRTATEPTPLPERPGGHTLEEDTEDDDGRPAEDGSSSRPAVPNPAPRHP